MQCSRQVQFENNLNKNIFVLFCFLIQKRKDLSSVGEMKQFVAKDLRNLQQQHKSLQTRKKRIKQGGYQLITSVSVYGGGCL